MAEGPILSYDNDRDLERHFVIIRGHGIQITELPLTDGDPVALREFRFQRGFGAVHGFADGEQDEQRMYLGCDHFLNPFYWRPDMRLLSEIESIMVAAGSRRL